jgi:20S proteasome subunit alpha 7
MTSIGTGYDLSSSTYSPDGRIFQVEYAGKAVENSGTAIGLRAKDGVVLAVEKLVHSKLLVPGVNRRIQTIDRHIGMATAGLLADGRHLANRASDEAQNYRDTYHSPAPLASLADRLALYVQAYTLYSSVRPFGISAVIAGLDKGGPQLFIIEPSGEYYGYHGAAVGKGRQLAKTELEKLKLSELTVREAVFEAARIIHKVHDDAKDKEFELELSWVGPETGGLHLPVPKDLFEEADKKARDALNEDMED